jgi:homeobox protein cut-like
MSAEGGEPTLVSVLGAQRDRLRARVAELEAEAAAGAAAAAAARAAAEAARADNVALVERLRYVQSYEGAGGASAGGAGAGAAAAAAAAGDLEAGRAAAAPDSRAYEERVNPLGDFRAREREARRAALPAHDRAAFALSSALVGGSRATRAALAVYAFLLHAVAFAVLAGFSARHADRLEELQDLCGQLHPLDAGGGALDGGGGGAGGGDASTGGAGALVDPVIGGAVAESGRRLLARLMPRA